MTGFVAQGHIYSQNSCSQSMKDSSMQVIIEKNSENIIKHQTTRNTNLSF